jgi:hypothetical protein
VHVHLASMLCSGSTHACIASASGFHFCSGSTYACIADHCCWRLALARTGLVPGAGLKRVTLLHASVHCEQVAVAQQCSSLLLSNYGTCQVTLTAAAAAAAAAEQCCRAGVSACRCLQGEHERSALCAVLNSTASVEYGTAFGIQRVQSTMCMSCDTATAAAVQCITCMRAGLLVASLWCRHSTPHINASQQPCVLTQTVAPV